MYKFTNGIVVFDEKTRDNYLKAGYKLIESKKDNITEKQLVDNNEVNDENSSNDGTIEKKSRRSKKVSK